MTFSFTLVYVIDFVLSFSLQTHSRLSSNIQTPLQRKLLKWYVTLTFPFCFWLALFLGQPI